MDSLAQAERPTFERWIGPLPGLKEARAISTLALIAGAILCAASLYYGFHRDTFMGRPLGGDFVQFYSAGKILNTGPAAGIYDISTIVRVEHESLPTMPDTADASVRQRSIYRRAVPSAGAVAVSICVLRVAGHLAVVVLCRFGDPDRPASPGSRLPAGLSSPMFLLETWIGGQISVIAFLGIALFVDCFLRKRWFLAGLSLVHRGVQTIINRDPRRDADRWSMLGVVAGVIAGSALAGVFSIATAGVDGCVRWIDTLRVFGLLATGDQASIRRIKYVDFNSFFSILFGANGIARTAL